MMRRRVVLLFVLVLSSVLQAQTIRVAIDATDAPRKLFRAHLEIPAAPGPMKLAYAKWLPGEHGPTGPITDLVDLRIKANGQPVEWHRDPRDMFVFTIDVPRGASSIDVDLAYLAPTGERNFTAGPSATANLAIVAWNTLLLYPPGKSGESIMVEGSMTVPSGWKSASALGSKGRSGDRIDFERASLTTYIDSPVIIGRYMKVVPISVPSAPPHRIDIVAESNAALATWPDFAADYGRLVAEAGALFGAYHFRKYDWLLTLSDDVAHFGLEHHESSDDRREEDTLQKQERHKSLAGLLSHEYVHSWNGKYRRPAGLLSPDYQTPMEGNLLWVYEGLTQYLGLLLDARSGLWTPEDWREDVANIAAGFENEPGRTWRPLSDTTTGAQILYGSSAAWRSLRRGTDFYDESVLLWLEADSIIRQKTNGRASLDDFIHRFHGGEGGVPALKPYTYDELIAALNAVAPYDWRAHFDARLGSRSPHAPMNGLTADGWKLVYDDTPNTTIKANEERGKFKDASYSLGLILLEDGTIRDAILGLPAANAGIGPGMKVIAVNGRRWKPEGLDAALQEKTSPIELLVENNDTFRTYAVDYQGGPRYPHLIRDEEKPDGLAAVLAPRAGR